jgi:molybdopterin converting factor small subunit
VLCDLRQRGFSLQKVRRVIRFLQKEETLLHDNDVLSIVPSIAGGTRLRCICS